MTSFFRLDPDEIEQIVDLFQRTVALNGAQGDDATLGDTLRTILQGGGRIVTAVVSLHGVPTTISDAQAIREALEELNEADRLSWGSVTAPIPLEDPPHATDHRPPIPVYKG
jgi:hypothetical protein